MLDPLFLLLHVVYVYCSNKKSDAFSFAINLFNAFSRTNTSY